jgi:hypothetical protein
MVVLSVAMMMSYVLTALSLSQDKPSISVSKKLGLTASNMELKKLLGNLAQMKT